MSLLAVTRHRSTTGRASSPTPPPALAELGGNLEDSTMTILRGHFTMVLLVSTTRPARRVRPSRRLATSRGVRCAVGPARWRCRCASCREEPDAAPTGRDAATCSRCTGPTAPASCRRSRRSSRRPAATSRTSRPGRTGDLYVLLAEVDLPNHPADIDSLRSPAARSSEAIGRRGVVDGARQRRDVSLLPHLPRARCGAVVRAPSRVDSRRPPPRPTRCPIRSSVFADAGQTLAAAACACSRRRSTPIRAHPAAAFVEDVTGHARRVPVRDGRPPRRVEHDADTGRRRARTPQERAQQAAEVPARTGADRRWLAAAFAAGVAARRRAMVIVDADRRGIRDGAARSEHEPSSRHRRGDRVRQPVLLFHGDSHVYRSDNPLAAGAPSVTEASPAVPGDPTATMACPVDDATMHPGYAVPNLPPGRRARQHVPPRVAQADRAHTWATGVR